MSPGARRTPAVLVIASLAGAACCAGASAIVWWRRSYHDPLVGSVREAVAGSELLGELIPVALVALAGLGATFATRGVLRRAVGVLVALTGLLVAVHAVVAAWAAPLAALAGRLPRPATPVGPAELVVAGTAVAMLRGPLVLVAGVLVAVGADRARRMGSDYDTPARRREQALRRAQRGEPGSSVVAADPAELWRAMDAGTDLTAVLTAHPRADLTSNPPGVGRSTPGQGPPPRADTISAPDGPEDGESGRAGQSEGGGRGAGSDPPCQAQDEETTG